MIFFLWKTKIVGFQKQKKIVFFQRSPSSSRGTIPPEFVHDFSRVAHGVSTLIGAQAGGCGARPFWALVSEPGFSDLQICRCPDFEISDFREIDLAKYGFEISKKNDKGMIKVFWGDPGQNGGF